MAADWSVILPHTLLAAGGLMVWCLGAFFRVQRPEGLFAVSLAACLVAGLAAVIFQPPAAEFQGMIEAGGTARFFTVLLLSITVLSLLLVFQVARNRGFGGDEFYGLILFAALGMILVACSIHWLSFFLGLEILSLSLYVLIGCRRGESLSSEAAVKYFVMGSVASGFLTFGIAMIYAATGRMNIAQSLTMAAQSGEVVGLLLGMSLVLVGLAFKLSLVPFHLWTPDVYQGAPAAVTAFLSTGSKVAVFSALVRLTLSTGDATWPFLSSLLWVLAALTMVVGNVTALAQTHVKRLLAYSSMAHMGYLVMALLAVKQTGPAAILFYLVVYALMDLGAFGAVALLSPGLSDRDAIEEYRGTGFSQPWLGALLTVCLFSLAGLPPFAGFIGKFLLFKSAIQAGFLKLALIGIVTAILSVAFYLRVIVTLYMREETIPLRGAVGGVPASLACWFVLAGLILIGLLPAPLLRIITQALEILII